MLQPVLNNTMGLTTLFTAMMLLALSQITNQTLATSPTPSDARSNQFEDPKGTSWKAFSVDSFPDGPLAFVEVSEVRQQNPPSSWAAFVKNTGLMPVNSYTVGAAVVTGDGKVKAVQKLPTIKNLKPGQVRRQEVRLTVATLNPSDRVVFYIHEAQSDSGPWQAVDSEVATLIRDAAMKLPVQ